MRIKVQPVRLRSGGEVFALELRNHADSDPLVLCVRGGREAADDLARFLAQTIEAKTEASVFVC